jgi:TP901-1 family phage major tail protein
MTKYAGKELLLKRGNGASPEVFTTIGGQRTTGFTIGNEEIDVTDKDDSRWKKLIEGGVRNMSLSCSGIVNDSAAQKALMQASVDGTIGNYQIIFADGQTFTGPFLVSSFGATGEYTDAQQFELTLNSAGDIAYDSTP